jgi:glucokinase
MPSLTATSGGTLGAVDVGGTHLRTALVSPDGQLEGKTRVRIRPDEEISQVADAVRALVAGRAVRQVVIGMPGRIDRRTGLLEQTRNLPGSWLSGLQADAIGERAGCDVVLAGDAELAVLGEAWFGAGTRTGDTAYLTLSTGVGTAAASRGRLIAGQRVGLQLGFIRPGGPGTPILDSLASGQQLAALARVLGRAELSVQDLLGLVDAGDERARRTWDQIVYYGAWAALALCHAVNPDVLVIGGGLTAAGDRLLGPLAAGVQAELAAESGLAVLIRRSQLGDDAALAGAAAFTATAGHPCPATA